MIISFIRWVDAVGCDDQRAIKDCEHYEIIPSAGWLFFENDYVVKLCMNYLEDMPDFQDLSPDDQPRGWESILKMNIVERQDFEVFSRDPRFAIGPRSLTVVDEE